MGDMAIMCIALRISPPEYWALTYEEHQALVKELNKAKK